MFNLKTASIGIRKVAYMEGIRQGEWEPISHDEFNIAKVISDSGKEIVIDRAMLDHANDLTWSEIK